MKLTEEELQKNLLEELYEFVKQHPEIQISHSLYGVNLLRVDVDSMNYVCDKPQLNAFVRGYQMSYETNTNKKS